MYVQEVLSGKGSEVYKVSPEASVFDAISEMADRNVGALLVMEHGRLEGIISERDYRNKVILMGRTSKQTRVKEIMTYNVFWVKPEESIENCMAIMTQKKIRHLPVLDAGENVLGVISIGDLVKAIIDQQELEINDMRSYISGSYPG
ncbi:MAG: CBS domain-containing protein [Balneolales bacterium]